MLTGIGEQTENEFFLSGVTLPEEAQPAKAAKASTILQRGNDTLFL
jgi:hypothetical protein